MTDHMQLLDIKNTAEIRHLDKCLNAQHEMLEKLTHAMDALAQSGSPLPTFINTLIPFYQSLGFCIRKTVLQKNQQIPINKNILE